MSKSFLAKDSMKEVLCNAIHSKLFDACYEQIHSIQISFTEHLGSPIELTQEALDAGFDNVSHDLFMVLYSDDQTDTSLTIAKGITQKEYDAIKIALIDFYSKYAFCDGDVEHLDLNKPANFATHVEDENFTGLYIIADQKGMVDGINRESITIFKQNDWDCITMSVLGKIN